MYLSTGMLITQTKILLDCSTFDKTMTYLFSDNQKICVLKNSFSKSFSPNTLLTSSLFPTFYLLKHYLLHIATQLLQSPKLPFLKNCQSYSFKQNNKQQ